MRLKNKDLEKKLIVGAKIKIGPKYARGSRLFKAGQIISLVEGQFDYENGLYTTYQTFPAWWNPEERDCESIYHLFENDLSGFLDCEVVK